MHRSGTSLMSHILQGMGVFLGAEQKLGFVENDTSAAENLGEAESYVRINDWILRQCSATWDRPEAYLEMPLNGKLMFTPVVRRWVSHYWGEFVGEQEISLLNAEHPWGWKDPRTCLLYEVWDKVFPNATYIHVYRNPIDVAWSLYRREVKRNRFMLRKILEDIDAVFRDDFYSALSSRGIHLDSCVDLWKIYVERCMNIQQILPHAKVLHIQFEEMLQSPLSTLEQVREHCQLTVAEDTLSHLASTIRSDRRYAFLSEPKLVDLYQKNQSLEIMKRLQYSDLL